MKFCFWLCWGSFWRREAEKLGISFSDFFEASRIYALAAKASDPTEEPEAREEWDLRRARLDQIISLKRAIAAWRQDRL
ncbi:hypothetical protein [Bradyrhizobium sp. 195]|uniref:hypothetical protein n=1 Tax=Bradyrhizobium sp. 195 TaxID=2782662 RepID=UPI002000B86E|nr:hypothetical protein [Bradyrhizobium sp. 195]